MANDISTNPWLLDTVSASLVWPGVVFVDHFEFVDYINDTDTATVVDESDRVVWKANGANDLQEVRSGKVGTIRGGLRLSSITNGSVKVYIR